MKIFGLVKKKHENVFEYLIRGISGPIARILSKTPITPNQVTISRGIIMIFCFYQLYLGDYVNLIISAICIFLWEILDCVDGDLATLKNQCSVKGEWLEGVIDTIFGTVFGLLGFFITIFIYKDIGGIYPWIILFFISFGWFMFKFFLHLEPLQSQVKPLNKLLQEKEKTKIGRVVHACYYWTELYAMIAMFLYYPIYYFFNLNSLFLIMIFFAVMYNSFWIGFIIIQWRQFHEIKEK
ncbi:CDP-alcohol phosphatidyltransferase family protein [bacterium]|nr:CDP-alcohol phosphatidyltransferase family protein [bacterium]